ncbi:MAG: GNAT family N-acetyltransferase [Clostridium celatum]|nr:GNAT family N-acetyltransferase [Clostridium celatum]
MIIRRYETSDCKYVAELFYNTVHFINSKDYTEEQLNVWATGNIDLEQWNQSLMSNFSFVAVEDELIVGFGDIDRTGYLDRLYVHKDYQNKGIATEICDKLECILNVDKIITHASITARTFFEKRGYKVIKKQSVERSGVLLQNYIMEKKIIGRVNIKLMGV